MVCSPTLLTWKVKKQGEINWNNPFLLVQMRCSASWIWKDQSGFSSYIHNHCAFEVLSFFSFLSHWAARFSVTAVLGSSSVYIKSKHLSSQWAIIWTVTELWAKVFLRLPEPRTAESQWRAATRPLRGSAKHPTNTNAARKKKKKKNAGKCGAIETVCPRLRRLDISGEAVIASITTLLLVPSLNEFNDNKQLTPSVSVTFWMEIAANCQFSFVSICSRWTHRSAANEQNKGILNETKQMQQETRWFIWKRRLWNN